VELSAAIEVLLDVAYATQYLHSMQLVHGDIKVRRSLAFANCRHGLPLWTAPREKLDSRWRVGAAARAGWGAMPRCVTWLLLSRQTTTSQLENILLKSDNSRALKVIPKVRC
jgi:serine/threonine protein kinase